MDNSDSAKQNGWNEYSRLVLKELETLADGIDILTGEIQVLKQEVAKIQAREDKVDDLRTWRNRMEESATPTQIKDALAQIEDLKAFKTKAITVFAVAQFVMAVFAIVVKFIV